MYNKFLQILFRLCFAISIPLATIIHVSLNRYSPNVHIVKTFIDDIVPLNKYFAVPYLFMFLYITTALVYFAIVDYKYYFKLLASIVFGMLLCFVVYYYFPTTVPRPDVSGSDFFTTLVINIYANDNPFNCFPSIHVLSAYLPLLFALKYKKSTFMKVFTIVGCISISLSTLFLKQHYFLDAVASIFLGTALYLLFTSEYLWNRIPIHSMVDLVMPSKLKNFIKG